MSSLPIDTRLDALVDDAVANYGQYTGNVVGLGHGRVDRVLELPVLPMADWQHAYTKTPMISAYKLACDSAAKVRSFVYAVPLEVREGRLQRMRVGSDGEDLDIATFFRVVGENAPSGEVHMAMPSKAFEGEGDEVEYAFRVRNYLQMGDGSLVLLDSLQIGMELTTSAQKKHARRGVMLITNERMFSFQLGEEGDKQAGFRMQYVAGGSMTDAAPAQSKAVLHTQAFGFVVRPPSAEERLMRYLRSHFHLCPCVQTKCAPATRGGGGRTRGSSSSMLSHAKALAGEARQVSVSVSAAEPIAERATVELCLVVGDVARVWHEKHVEAQVSGPDVEQSVGPMDLTTTVEVPEPTGFSETMRCLARMMIASDNGSAQKTEIRQVIDDLRAWPTLKVNGPLGSLAPSNIAALAVGVVECEDVEDEEGQGLSKMSGGNSTRVYSVRVGTLLRVRLTNFSLGGEHLQVWPFYYSMVDDSMGQRLVEEEEPKFTLTPGETFELPFPIQKNEDDGEEGWILKDGDGRTVLKISFVLNETEIARSKARREMQRREEAEKAQREKNQRERDAMLVDGPGGEPVVPECCVCLTAKSLAEIVVFTGCGHGVCCATCYAKIAATDSAAGRRSTCPKCRAPVQDVVRVYF